MTKQEFNQMMKEAGVTIIKRRGSNEGGIYVAIEGMTMGVAVTFTRRDPCWPCPDLIIWKDYCIERRKQNEKF